MVDNSNLSRILKLNQQPVFYMVILLTTFNGNQYFSFLRSFLCNNFLLHYDREPHHGVSDKEQLPNRMLLKDFGECCLWCYCPKYWQDYGVPNNDQIMASQKPYQPNIIFSDVRQKHTGQQLYFLISDKHALVKIPPTLSIKNIYIIYFRRKMKLWTNT